MSEEHPPDLLMSISKQGRTVGLGADQQFLAALAVDVRYCRQAAQPAGGGHVAPVRRQEGDRQFPEQAPCRTGDAIVALPDLITDQGVEVLHSRRVGSLGEPHDAHRETGGKRRRTARAVRPLIGCIGIGRRVSPRRRLERRGARACAAARRETGRLDDVRAASCQREPGDASASGGRVHRHRGRGDRRDACCRVGRVERQNIPRRASAPRRVERKAAQTNGRDVGACPHHPIGKPARGRDRAPSWRNERLRISAPSDRAVGIERAGEDAARVRPGEDHVDARLVVDVAGKAPRSGKA